jgi:hypothetical protein
MIVACKNMHSVNNHVSRHGKGCPIALIEASASSYTKAKIVALCIFPVGQRAMALANV